MNKNKNIEEVKERLNNFKSIRLDTSSDVFMIHIQQFTKIQDDVKILLEELDKKDRQLEEKTNRIKNLEKECQKTFDNMMDTIVKNVKQEAMINEMTKLITNTYNSDPDSICLDLDKAELTVEEAKQYFERKINNDKTIS